MMSLKKCIHTGVLCLGALIINANASVLCGPTAATTVHQFPNQTWAENLAIRSNGQILVTTLAKSVKLWQIDPFNGRDSIVVHEWSNETALTGIAEVEPDVFAVVVSDLSLSPVRFGSYEVWRVDLRRDFPNVSLITPIPEAKLLNGMAAFNRVDGTVLIADSLLNSIWSLNTRTGTYAQVIRAGPTISEDSNSTVELSVNGVHVFGEHIYFDNTATETFFRVPRYAVKGYSGPIHVVANLTVAADDFTFDIEGNAYIAGSNKITKVSKYGTQCVFSNVQGSTSAAWGRTPLDANTLYVTTKAGQLVAIRV